MNLSEIDFRESVAYLTELNELPAPNCHELVFCVYLRNGNGFEYRQEIEVTDPRDYLQLLELYSTKTAYTVKYNNGMIEFKQR